MSRLEVTSRGVDTYAGPLRVKKQRAGAGNFTLIEQSYTAPILPARKLILTLVRIFGWPRRCKEQSVGMNSD